MFFLETMILKLLHEQGRPMSCLLVMWKCFAFTKLAAAEIPNLKARV